ncbi:hypothetical protein [Aeromonas media]|uniref:hypothetical protein n=1 Tax=Aeromonas media TaxID=651 RepID=UPI0038CF8F20
MGWSVISNDEKKQHQLFDKKSALEWFATGMIVCGIIGLIASISQIGVATQLNAGESTLLIIGACAQPLFTVIMCSLFNANKKTKKGAVIIWILILLLPIISFGATILMNMQVNGGYVGYESVVGLIILCVIFAITYGVYSFISPVFRLQYRNQVKI